MMIHGLLKGSRRREPTSHSCCLSVGGYEHCLLHRQGSGVTSAFSLGLLGLEGLRNGGGKSTIDIDVEGACLVLVTDRCHQN